MATVNMHMEAPPKKVWDVLADGSQYAQWVVGAKRIRDVDPDWPTPGTKIRHTVGVGPLEINDSTEVVEASEPSRLVLDARARPLIGRARVTVNIAPEGNGSRVVMEEHVPAWPALLNALVAPIVNARNAEALRRLRRHVEDG
jgi:uncharacterized protein YndB with AHSA1/START domain